MQAKLTAANAGIDGVTSAVAPWKTKVNERETAYEGVRKLVTRVVNSFAASGAEDNAVEDAKSIKRKIDGARATALPPDDPGTPEDESKGKFRFAEKLYAGRREFRRDDRIDGEQSGLRSERG